jgi:hypothetical protein
MRKATIYILILLLVSFSVEAVEKSLADKQPATDDPVDLLVQVDDETNASDTTAPLPDRMDKRPGFGHRHKRFEQIRKKKLLELLQLDEDKVDEFMNIMNDHRRKSFEWVKAHLATSDSLARGLRSKALSGEEIERFVDRLDKLEGDRLDQTRAFHNQVRPLLTAEQFGKLVVFQIRFEAEALGKLNEFRRHRGRPGSGRPLLPPDVDSFLERDSI